MAKTLLLADDSVTIQKVVGISFAGEDVDLITVDNGDDAIAKAREARPDIVLSDVVMPGKNGYEVCEAIKSDPALAHIPVLLLTGTFEAFDEERAAHCGAAGHVAKPFEAQTLVERVAQLLANPAPAAAPVAAPVSAPTAPAAPQSQPAVLGQTPVEQRRMSMPPSDGAAVPTSEMDSINDQSFDFFDDELAATPPPVAADQAAPLDLDPADSAFAFGEDDLGASDLGGDRTVAMIPDEPAPARPPMAPLEDLLATPAPTPAAPAPVEDDLLPPPIEPPNTVDDAFDFENNTSFGEGDLLAPLSDEELAQETVLDPKGASGYDVSSSDLRESPVAAPEPVAPAPPAPPAPPAMADEATVMVGAMPPAAARPDPAVVGADLFSDDMPFDSAPPPDPGRETVLAAPDPEPMSIDEPSLEAMIPAAPPEPPMPEPPMPEPMGAPQPAAMPPPPVPVMPEPAAAPELTPEPAAAPELMPEPARFATPEPMPAPDPFAAHEPLAAPEPEPMPEPSAIPAPAPAPEPVAAPLPTPEPFAAAEPMPMPAAEPFAAPEFESMAPPEPAPWPETAAESEPGPMPHDSGSHDSAGVAGIALAEIEPALREQLHDTLEKIAWESFGDVTEQIVRQALERVERIAWEVIPQMAETMIREEIKKLKGEG